MADFVGDMLFNEDGSGLKAMLSDLEIKDRNAIIQYLRDFINYLKKRFAGDKDISFAISHLEDSFNRMLSEAVQTQKNTAENSGDVQFSIGYTNANINSELATLINKVESGEFKANEKVIFGTVSDVIANKIKTLTGINVSGFKMAIEARQVEHILKDHGVNGKTDHSMSNDLDIAKIEYTLNNPDDIRNAGKTQAYTYMREGRNRTADTVLYEKNIGEKSYYVVQAVADTKAKTLYIVTAFIGEKGYKKEASQLINANSPDATPNSGSVQASNNSILENEDTVNNNSMQEGSNNSKNIKFSFARSNDTSLVAQAEQMENDGASREEIWEELGLMRDADGVWIYEIDDNGNIISLDQRFDGNKKDIRYSMPRKAVDSYSEEQYNNFGWASYNEVITPVERETLLSRYADYKHNKDNYPTTRFGEAVIHSTECLDVIMYVKGNIKNPQITKIVRIKAETEVEATIIKEGVLANEYDKVSLPYEAIEDAFGSEVLDISTKRDFTSFQQYRAEQEGKTGGKDDTDSGTSSDRTIGTKQNKENDSAGLKESAFSMPNETVVMFNRLKAGEITDSEYEEFMDDFWDRKIAEMEDRQAAQEIAWARYGSQLKARNKRLREQLQKRRSEVVREETERREERANKQTNINVIRREIARK